MPSQKERKIANYTHTTALVHITQLNIFLTSLITPQTEYLFILRNRIHSFLLLFRKKKISFRQNLV